jgi:hypothetical protein
MAARLTVAEARALGIDVGATTSTRQRTVARAPYHTRCTTCDERFTVEARERRHSDSEHHWRFELVLERAT